MERWYFYQMITHIYLKFESYNLHSKKLVDKWVDFYVQNALKLTYEAGYTCIWTHLISQFFSGVIPSDPRYKRRGGKGCVIALGSRTPLSTARKSFKTELQSYPLRPTFDPMQSHYVPNFLIGSRVDDFDDPNWLSSCAIRGYIIICGLMYNNINNNSPTRAFFTHKTTLLPCMFVTVHLSLSLCTCLRACMCPVSTTR